MKIRLARAPVSDAEEIWNMQITEDNNNQSM